jgi:hypothetical protein
MVYKEVRVVLVHFWEAWIQKRSKNKTLILVAISQAEDWETQSMSKDWRNGDNDNKKKRNMFEKKMRPMRKIRNNCNKQFMPTILRLMRNTSNKCKKGLKV